MISIRFDMDMDCFHCWVYGENGIFGANGILLFPVFTRGIDENAVQFMKRVMGYVMGEK